MIQLLITQIIFLINIVQIIVFLSRYLSYFVLLINLKKIYLVKVSKVLKYYRFSFHIVSLLIG